MSQNGPTTPANNGAFNRLGVVVAPTLSFGQDTTNVHSGADAYAALANITWMENNTIGFNGTYVRDNGSLSNIGGNDLLGSDKRIGRRTPQL